MLCLSNSGSICTGVWAEIYALVLAARDLIYGNSFSSEAPLEMAVNRLVTASSASTPSELASLIMTFR